ncbi:6-hydroxy-D-nicotine oxidase [Lachnellula suecica]|uniref:6-hydroxy-D-nicotine oxidase n=1 Tax=Lachnellula suecica TaxID=602035 RepID=A0A8T9CHM4_9HELO|nr:6-hydroxy-D-nicotine oxidase [Lachnellula suecica]
MVSAPSVVWRDSPGYEEARIGRVFNHRRPDRYPKGVVQPINVEEVASAVKLANQMNLRVSVRSGGHSWAAWSVRDEALLIDLGNLKCLELNESSGIVKASPSTTGRVLNEYLATKGKMFGSSDSPLVVHAFLEALLIIDTTLGGFLLQGGMGWNCKNWGWACERIVAVEVVTADGEILLCDKDNSSDLFWAARGAGPGFPAIVTSFYLEARNVFSNIMKSTFIWPLEQYKTIMDWTIDTTPKCDESIEVVCVSLRPDPTKEPVILSSFVTFQNSEEAATASLKLANDTRPPGAIMTSINEPSSLPLEYVGQDMANPKGFRYNSDNAYIDNNADAAEVLREAFTTLPEGTKTFALWFAMNPCSRRELPDMALSMQSDHYFALYTIWEDPKDDERCDSWLKNVMAKVERKSVGAYLGDSDFQVRRTRFWEDSQGKKLMEIRRKWDPRGTVCGFLDQGDKSGVNGLENRHEWHENSA